MPTIAPIDLGNEHCLFAGFIEDIAVFATASGTLSIQGSTPKTQTIHDGIFAASRAQDGKSLITAGEDGRVCRTDIHGTDEEFFNQSGKWITALAVGRDMVAWGIGRQAWVKIGNKEPIVLDHPRSVEGLAFAPKGTRLAVARYNGVTLHWPGTETKPQELEWKGAHIGVFFSPDNRFILTSMQENAMHGWRLEDQRHLRMSGYPAKVKSWSWSVKGRWLATSGAPAAIVWPFTGKDGPMGKAPMELGTRGDAMVVQVCCHPQEEMVAIGYDDGMILLVRFSDQREVVLRRSGKGAITALQWDDKGERLAFGAQTGDCGIISLAD